MAMVGMPGPGDLLLGTVLAVGEEASLVLPTEPFHGLELSKLSDGVLSCQPTRRALAAVEQANLKRPQTRPETKSCGMREGSEQSRDGQGGAALEQ